MKERKKPIKATLPEEPIKTYSLSDIKSLDELLEFPRGYIGRFMLENYEEFNPEQVLVADNLIENSKALTRLKKYDGTGFLKVLLLMILCDLPESNLVLIRESIKDSALEKKVYWMKTNPRLMFDVIRKAINLKLSAYQANSLEY